MSLINGNTNSEILMQAMIHCWVLLLFVVEQSTDDIIIVADIDERKQIGYEMYLSTIMYAGRLSCFPDVILEKDHQNATL